MYLACSLSVCWSLLRHSITSSLHLLHYFPHQFLPFMTPNSVCITNHTSDILHVCLKIQTDRARLNVPPNTLLVILGTSFYGSNDPTVSKHWRKTCMSKQVSLLWCDLLHIVINKFFMKLFRMNNIDTVKICQSQFCFELPSSVIKKRAIKFETSLKHAYVWKIVKFS